MYHEYGFISGVSDTAVTHCSRAADPGGQMQVLVCPVATAERTYEKRSRNILTVTQHILPVLLLCMQSLLDSSLIVITLIGVIHHKERNYPKIYL